MKKLLFLLFLLLLFNNNVYASNLPDYNICVRWASYYEIDLNFLESIWIKEGRISDCSKKSKYNSDGSRDIGYFQINTKNFDFLKDTIRIKDLAQVNDNIKSACFLIYSNRVYLEDNNIPITTFNQAAMYHNAQMFLDYWYNRLDSTVVDYATEVFKIYWTLCEN